MLDVSLQLIFKATSGSPRDTSTCISLPRLADVSCEESICVSVLVQYRIS